MKLTRINILSISHLIQKWAIKVMKVYPTSKEWKVAIISLVIVKAGTMIVSSYAAYSFFYNYIFIAIDNDNMSIILTIIILALLEILTAIFLTKWFKFLFLKMYLISFYIFFTVAVFYSVSFVSSTNGLAQRQAQAIDCSTKIKNNSLKVNEEIKSEQNKNLQEINNIIVDIRNNPLAWSGRKRVYLTQVQQENILLLEQKKTNIRETYMKQLEKNSKSSKKQLDTNKKNMLNIANNYYWFMSLVMFVQFLVTGILIYLLHTIYHQEHEQTHEFEIAHKNSIASNKNTHQIQKLAVHETINRNINEQLMVDYRRYLAKHKEVVQSILMNVSETQTHLSNSEINTEILPLLKAAKHKSPSLIRKVFVKMQALGIANFSINK